MTPKEEKDQHNQNTISTDISPQRDKNKISSRWIILLSVCTATFLMPMSMSSLNIALPAIASDLSASAATLSLIPTISLIGAISIQLPAGRLADVLGRKWIFMTGLILYTVSSTYVIFTQTTYELLLIRLFQGFSSAFIFGTGMAIVSHAFHDYKRGLALGLTATSIYTGLTCGPLVGGYLTDIWGWRSVIIFPVPLAVICLVLIHSNIDESIPSKKEQN